MKRNWVIKSVVINGRRVVVFHGRFGEAARKGLLEERLIDIVNRQVKWEYFEKKKDFEEKLKNMEVWF